MVYPLSSSNVSAFHAHFTGAVARFRDEFPEFYAEKLEKLDSMFGIVSSLTNENSLSKGKSNDFKLIQENWEKDVRSTLIDMYYDLKLHRPAQLELYFNDGAPSAIRTNAKRMSLLNHVHSLATLPNHQEMKKYIDPVQALIERGVELMDGRGKSTSAGKSTRNKLNEAMNDYKRIYGQMKKLLDVYFEETSIDYRSFFLDLAPKRGGKTASAVTKSASGSGKTPQTLSK